MTDRGGRLENRVYEGVAGTHGFVRTLYLASSPGKIVRRSVLFIRRVFHGECAVKSALFFLYGMN